MSVVVDESYSDLQVSHREVWERGSNSEIVAPKEYELDNEAY